MKFRNTHRIVAAALTLSCAAAIAQSGPTGWEIRGQVVTFSNPTGDIDIPIGVGSPVRAVVNFNTTTSLQSGVNVFTGQPVTGKYQQNNAPASIALYVGGFGPFIFAPPAPGTRNPDGTFMENASITVRDRAVFPENQATALVDGYSFSTRTLEDGVTTNVIIIFRGDNDSLVSSANKLPFVPPAALADPTSLAALPEALIQVCRSDGTGSGCNRGEVSARINSVAVPTFGTTWILTTRDCQNIDSGSSSADASPNDCFRIGPESNGQGLAYGRYANQYTGLGVYGFDTITFAPTSGLPGPSFGQSLGSVVGKVTFGELAALPILKGGSFPSDISRTNSNILAYQRYDYVGPATSLPLVVDLTYGIADYSVDTTISEIGIRPGGATITAVLAIVDADAVAVPQLPIAGFGSFVCGNEGTLGWPAGSILGVATYRSAEGDRNSAASAVLDVRSCADSSQPVQLKANQKFIVASSLQTPARGKWTLNSNKPAAGGYVDALNTMRVTFDPSAPPALVQNLVQNIAPACTDCGSATARVDVRPGDSSCINPKLRGVVPAAFLGSATLDVKTIRIDDNLKLGLLSPRKLDDRALCSVSDVNADGYLDLICHFDNQASAWVSGQSTVTLSGMLQSGLPVSGADFICVK